MRTSKHILRQVFIYASSQYTAQAIGFASSFLLRRFLGPFAMGVWATTRMITSFASNCHLGAMGSIFFRFPRLKAENRIAEAEEIQNLTFSFISVMLLVTCIGLIGYAFLFRSHIRPETFKAFVGAGIILFFQRSFNFHIGLLRANKDIEILSRVIIFEAIMNLLFMLILVRSFKLYGIFCSAILLPVLCVIYIHHFKRYRIRWLWKSKLMMENMRFGLPIFIRDTLDQLLDNVDKVMVVSLLGYTQAGLYSIATMARGYSEGVYRNFSHVLGPYLVERVDKHGDLREATTYVEKPTFVLSHFMSVLIGFIYVAASLLVFLFLRQYMDGVAAMKMYMLTIYFSTISTQANVFLSSLEKQKNMIPVSAGLIACGACLNLLVIRMGFGLVGIAAVSAFTSGLLFFISYLYAMRQTRGFADAVKGLLQLLWPAGLMTGIFAVTESTQYDMVTPMQRFMLQSFFYLLASWAIILNVNRRYHVLVLIKEVIMDRFKRA